MIEFIEREEGLKFENLKLVEKENNQKLTYLYPGTLNFLTQGELSNPSNFNFMFMFGFNYRIFDTTENYIVRRMIREQKKTASKVFNDLKVQEYLRISAESRAYYQVKELYKNIKFIYEQNRTLRRSDYKGSIYKDNLRFREKKIQEKNEIILDHLYEENRLRNAEKVFLSNIFRIEVICGLTDEIIEEII